MPLEPDPCRRLRRLRRLEQEIDDAFAELIDMPWGRLAPSAPTWWPPVDLYETEDAYILVADMPGVEREDIDLRVRGRQVVLHGSRRSIEWGRAGHDVYVERARGRFCRTFTVDEPVDADRAEATYKNGLFRAWIPKHAGGRGRAEESE